jgi:hypothetical protein
MVSFLIPVLAPIFVPVLAPTHHLSLCMCALHEIEYRSFIMLVCAVQKIVVSGTLWDGHKRETLPCTTFYGTQMLESLPTPAESKDEENQLTEQSK